MPKKKPNTKKPVKKPVKPLKITPAVSESGSRLLRLPPYRPFRFKSRRKAKPNYPRTANAFRLFGRAVRVLIRNWKLFLGIVVVYTVLNLVLVHGLASNGDLGSLKTAIEGTVKGTAGKVTSGLTLFVYLLGGSSSTSSTNADAGVYQTLLVIILSLVFIWSLRQVYNKQTIRVRDGFYRGVYPFVPFILVLLVIGLQLLPLVIGGFLYSTVISNGIAVGNFEHILWALLFFVLALVSLYMLCSSIFALYIVTLPDMTPVKALRSARQLVRYRRWVVFRKLLFLPVCLLILAVVIMLPFILFLTSAAEWVYFGLSVIGLAVIHSYMYALYRELLPHE